MQSGNHNPPPHSISFGILKLNIEPIHKRLFNKIEFFSKNLLTPLTRAGTGKTYASAFAMRELGFKRVLFLVHRGQLARQTDALGNTIKYEYGTLNKLTKTYTPFNGSENYSVTENQYDKNGNIILTKQTVQKEDSSTVKYSITQNEYNGLGLLSKVTLSGTGSSGKNITQYFYNNDGIETEMRTGLSSDSDTSYLKTEYVYDSRNHLVRTTDSTGYNSGTITYDLNGNVLTNTDLLQPTLTAMLQQIPMMR